MTPAKYKQQDCDFISDVMGSPVLHSTVLINLQNKSLISSTPTCKHTKPATPESTKSVRNILDQLCSPISMESEEWQIEHQIHENKKVETQAESDRTKTTEVPKPILIDLNEPTSSNCLNKFSQGIIKDITQNEFFDDISDVSLQFLCEATSHLVENPPPIENNTNIENNYDYDLSNKLGKSSCANKKKVEPSVNLLPKRLISCNNEKIGVNEQWVGRSNLIYSDSSLKLDVPSFIHLNDIFSEVKFLEEANTSFKNESKPKYNYASIKNIQNKSGKNDFCKKINSFQTADNFNLTECDIETENNILNDSFGISDTQFCKAAEAAELMSSLEKTSNTNINDSGYTDQITYFCNIEEEHKGPRDKKENLDASDKNNYKDVQPSKEKSVTLKNNCIGKQLNKTNQIFFKPCQGTKFLDINSEEKQSKEKLLRTNRTNFETQKTKMIEGSKVSDIKSLPNSTVCNIGQAQDKQSFKIPNLPLKKTNDLLSDVNHCTEFILNGFNTAKGMSSDHLFAETKNLSNNKLNHSDLNKTQSSMPMRRPEKTLKITKTKVKSLLDDNQCELEPVLKGFQMKSRHILKSSKNSLSTGISKHSLENSGFGQKLISKCFQTASGASGDLLEKAKCLLTNKKEALDPLINDAQLLPDKSQFKNYNVFEDFSTESDLVLQGFQTPKSDDFTNFGKTLDERDSMLTGLPCVPKHFSNVYQEHKMETVEALETPSEYTNIFKSDMLIESLEKNKQLINYQSYTTFNGFQTASGKSVNVSEESLEKAKQLFDDEQCLTKEDCRSIIKHYKKHQTLSDKTGKVTEKSPLKQMKQPSHCQPNALEKGFKTASRKLAKISEDSFRRAKQLFEDDDGKSVIEESSKATYLLSDYHPKSTQKGFQTASGKSVKISEEALRRAKQLLNDGPNPLEEDFQTDNSNSEITGNIKKVFDYKSTSIHKGFQTGSGKNVKISERSLERAKQLFDDCPNPLKEDLHTPSDKPATVKTLKSISQFPDHQSIPTQEGFQTASGKSVKISEEALKRAKQLFNDGPNPLEEDFQTANSNTVTEERKENINEIPHDQPTPIHKGFLTASGKNVKISEKSLQKAKQLFDDCPNLLKKDFYTPSDKSPTVETLKSIKQLSDYQSIPIQEGFQTASGKSVKISEEALKRAKQLFDDCPNQQEENFQRANSNTVTEETKENINEIPDYQSTAIHKGFQTASGKNVKISEESLERAKQLFDDSQNPLKNDLHTPSGKKATLDTVKCIKQLSGYQSIPIQKGFKTASGKSVKISEESLDRVKQLFDDDPSVIKGVFETSSSKQVKPSEESLQHISHQPNYEKNSIKNGFQTASGKSVNISEDSLKRAKQLFNDDPSIMKEDFQTVSSKTIKISEESLQNIKHSSNYQNNSMQKGFQTASGKSVNISEESFEKTKELFDDDLNIIKEGFQIGSKLVGETEKSHQLIKDAPLQPNLMPKGFQTANGKSVSISEESLVKAKNLLHNAALESTHGLNSLVCKQPIKNKNHISEKCSEEEFIENFHDEAVLKGFNKSGKIYGNNSKSILGKTLDTPDIGRRKLLPESIFNAFQTASGKGVTISEESLKKAKDLFRDDGNEADDLIQFESVGNETAKCTDSLRETLNAIDTGTKNLKTNKYIANLGSEANESLQVLQKDNNFEHNCEAGMGKVPQNIKVVVHKNTENLKRKQSSQLNCSSNNLLVNKSMPNKVDTSESKSLSKRRKLFVETDITSNEYKFVYDEQDNASIIGASVISEADLSLLNQSRTSLSGNETQTKEHCTETMSPSVAREVSESMAALLADEASNSPFSLKPCLSSPGMLYDRQVRLPSIDCYENETNINNKQLSPILGSGYSLNLMKHGKHKTESVPTPINILNKVNTSNTNTKGSNFKPPYATSTPNETQLQPKRKSVYSNMIAEREKRQKISTTSETDRDVSKARIEAALKQEQYVAEKLKKHDEIKPCKGSYLLRKQTETSRSLRDLTAKGPLSLFHVRQLNQYGVNKSVQDMSIRNVLEFKFEAVDYFSKETALSNINGIPVGDGALLILDEEGKAGVKEITRAFLASPSIDPTLVSKEWVENHFKWIVLKMAAMERMFPREFGNRYLTPNNLMLQLKYRYDREIDRNQRPALRKILEKDESAAKTMMLYVADILEVDRLKAEGQPDNEKVPRRPEQELVLSDGWYSVGATVDHEMESMVRRKKVGIGTKLMITGAELTNNESGCHPLETPANVRLRVSTNSCRRARWFARLGFHASGPRPARLRTVLGRGGALPSLTATVARSYPILFLEKVNGKTVIRGERAEQAAADEYQTKRQQCAEVILSQLQRDLESTRASKKQPVTRTSIKNATNTKHLYSLLDGVDDIGFLQDILSKDQLDEIRQLKEEEMRKTQQQLQDRLVDQLDKKLAPRNVTRMLKVRLVDEDEQTGRSALLTVWNPSDDMMNCLSEGNLLTFFNVSASGFSRFGDLQLTAGKQTKYSLQKHSPSPRRITTLPELQNSDHKPKYSEVDVVGLVVQSIDSTPDKTSSLIYLADTNHNFIGISFWTDLKTAGYANTLSPGSLVAASNLHWRSHLVSWRLPSAYATEMSTFSQHPRQPHLQAALAQLRDQVQSVNLARYMESCQERIKSLVAQRHCGGVQQESTPSGGPSGGGGNRGIVDNKLARDTFDASVSEITDTPTNRRLEMLGRYGEPPPITPLSTSTPTSVKRSFRPPTRKLIEKR